MASCHCCAANQQFDDRIARRDLRRYQRRGPDPVTRQLLAAIRQSPLPDSPTVLDVGGGVGAIHHELLDQGFAHATQVDASEAYLALARLEAARRGHQDHLTLAHGDFQALAATTPVADVVTLDRVVCCDPNYEGLLGAAADQARHILAFTYPRPHALTRVVVAVLNAWRRLWRRPFRVYVHPPDGMVALLEQRGFRRRWVGGSWIWAAELFGRAA